MNERRSLRSKIKTLLVYAVLGCMITAQTRAYAAEAELADVPLASSSTAAVKPNILFVLDDSGSMDWEYMPDEMGSYSGKTSYRSHVCNTIYYNPSITYAPPKNADGTNFPDSNFYAAKNNGYSSSSGTTDLSQYYYFGNDAYYQRAYYYTYSGTAPSPLSSTCQGSAPNARTSLPIFPDVNGSWTKVQVPTAQETNFANWYSYYSDRLKAMKGAASRAFVTLGSSYRVGFITINPNSPVTSSKYLKVADFDATQKSAWFTKLFGQSTNGSTPLRTALSRAGWIYGGKLNTGLTSGIPTADDPVQYSCQQNFTILTTDGYWNGGGGQQLDGSTMGNQDGNIATAPRPMFDNTTSTQRTQTLTTSYRYSSCTISGGKKGSSTSGTRIIKDVQTVNVDQAMSGGVVSGSPTTTSSTSSSNYTSCATSSPSLPATTVSGPTTSIIAGSTGSSDNLADTAQYYYATDLRTSTLGNCTSGSSGNNVCENNVPAAGTAAEDDKAAHQHMTTFTLGLGIFGTLSFSADYKTNTDPATTFNKIRNGTLNWPDANDGNNEKADDLWHTAVNGRGTAFAAYNPDDLITGLNAALSGVNARVASAAAAATSNLEPVAGDNFAYTASYETQRWVGELQAREIDLATGNVSTTAVWSAQAKLDAKTGAACDNRVIKLFRSGATNNLVDLKWDTYACDSSMAPTGSAVTTLDATEQGWFDSTEVATLSHYTSMTDGTSGTVNQRSAAAGAPLLNFVRGQRGKEGFLANDLNTLFRTRTHVLGDIVNAQPVFVKAPFGSFTDTGYSSYKSSNASRTPMVYVAANDGMLHAFYAGTSTSDTNGGVEAWAYVPRFVAPNLWQLASDNYKNLHQFFVDGTPSVGDVYDSATTSWKTIMVAGVNKGGKGFYALDVSDPATPKALWEFTYSATCYDAGNNATWGADCNLGYSYGNPAISKLSDGTWVVFVTSGYNNVNGATNDGQGYLYVLNAITGKIIKKIGTGTGSATTPSNLGKINNWVENGLTDNTTVRVYGADLLGNLWRFDVNSATPTSTRIATFKDASNNPQPITTKPELTSIGGNPHVIVTTGRYLGASDVSDTKVQSIYTIRDPLSSTAYTDPRTSLKKLTMVNGTTVINGVSTTTRTSSCTTNCSATDGWFVDLPDSGERVNVDVKLQLGTLTVLSNVPQNNACNIGGYSYINFFDYATGLAVPSSTGGSVGQKLSDSLAVGLNIVRLPSGKTVAIATTSDASQKTIDVPVASPGLTGRRVSWRELGE